MTKTLTKEKLLKCLNVIIKEQKNARADEIYTIALECAYDIVNNTYFNEITYKNYFTISDVQQQK